MKAQKPLFIELPQHESTQELGAILAKALTPPAIICLTGELGSGKTTFSQGFIRALGITQRITSPTVNLVHPYTDSNIPIHHLDVYRLHTFDELLDLGFDEFYKKGFTLIEWANHFEKELALYSPIYLTLEHQDKGRRARLSLPRQNTDLISALQNKFNIG